MLDGCGQDHIRGPKGRGKCPRSDEKATANAKTFSETRHGRERLAGRRKEGSEGTRHPIPTRTCPQNPAYTSYRRDGGLEDGILGPVVRAPAARS